MKKIINVFDSVLGANYVCGLLCDAGYDARPYTPRRQYVSRTNSGPALTIGTRSVEEVSDEISEALVAIRGNWLISSTSASLVAQDMLDLKGLSENIVYAIPELDGNLPILGSALTVDRAKRIQQLQSIHRRGKSSRAAPLVDASDLLAQFENLAYYEDEPQAFRPEFDALVGDKKFQLGSSNLAHYAKLCKITKHTVIDYVGLVARHLETR